MDKLSGLIIDVADDRGGEILRSIFPTSDGVPDLIKNASFVSEEQRAGLPDDLFALVLQDGDVSLRKFACADAGSTALSVEYFMKTAHRLPAAAQKVAAENLCRACEWYDIEPPEDLQKVALGVGAMMQLGLMGPEAARTARTGISMNMAKARQSPGMVNPAIMGVPSTPPQVG